MGAANKNVAFTFVTSFFFIVDVFGVSQISGALIRQHAGGDGMAAFLRPLQQQRRIANQKQSTGRLLSRLVRVAAAAAAPANLDFYYNVSSIPVREGTVGVSRLLRNNSEYQYNLTYKLFRPMSLSSRKAAPIVALHGGPSVPSDYLLPLAKAVPYRSILFYDQLGCGASDEPADISCYSIESAVDDLEAVLKKLSIRRFHLYGQSFGGILAYEYLKRQAEKGGFDEDEGCLSIILSSAPTNVAQVETDAERLASEVESPDLFRETHQCRTPTMPRPLEDAYAKAGTVWRGTTAIPDYVAQPPSEDASAAAKLPSCMVLRGEHDFVTTATTSKWKEVIWKNARRTVREKVLTGCSHHGLLEDPATYGDIVDTFFSEYD